MALHVGDADGHGVLFIGDLLLGGRGGQYLVLEEDYRVVVPDGALHQPLGIVRSRGHDQFQPSQVHEHRVGTLGVLCRGGAAAAGGGPEHQGEWRLPAEHVVNLGHLVHYLVHGGEREGHHAGADYGAETAARRADARAHVGLLRDGAGPHPLLSELGDQRGQRTMVAT